MNRVINAGYVWGVSHIFGLLSTQRHLTHEQRLQFKKDGRPCPKVTLKNRSSDSVYETYQWICGDAEKNTYFCWPCLVMGDIKAVYLFFHFPRSILNNNFNNEFLT